MHSLLTIRIFPLASYPPFVKLAPLNRNVGTSRSMNSKVCVLSFLLALVPGCTVPDRFNHLHSDANQKKARGAMDTSRETRLTLRESYLRCLQLGCTKRSYSTHD